MEIKCSKREMPKIRGPKCVYKLLLEALRFESEIDQDKEHFWVIGLNTKKPGHLFRPCHPWHTECFPLSS